MQFDKTQSNDALSNHVVICVPTNGMVHAQFTFALLNAIRYTEQQGIPVTLDMDAGTVLSNQRQVLLNNALTIHQAHHIMWFDSDMVFPPDTIIRLLEHNKKVACATYSKRVEPFHATAFHSIDPVEPVNLNDGNGLVKVKYTGMGCVLVNANAIKNIPPPHFPLTWHEPTSTWHGEDMGFCDLLKQNGINIFCDLALSRELGHLGIKEFQLSLAS